jgi:hypothetical protein
MGGGRLESEIACLTCGLVNSSLVPITTSHGYGFVSVKK